MIRSAYQSAVRYPLHRQYVLGLLATDPKVVRKTIAEQLERFIVKPFVEEKLLGGPGETVLVILDGLG